jgi:hypothetical protein
VRVELDASARLLALAGMGVFTAAFIAALAPFDVDYEFLDRGRVELLTAV